MQDFIHSYLPFLADPEFTGRWAYLSLPLSASLAIALILDWLLGDMKWLFNRIPHPVVIIGKLIAFLEKKLNRQSRSVNNRLVRGAITSIFVITLAALFGASLEYLADIIPWFWVFNLWIVSVMLAGRSLYSHVGAVAKGFKENGLEGGREAVSHIVGRDPKTLDQHGIVRASIESLAENFADGVVAPAFWFLLFGLPGIFAYKAVNTLDSMIGYKNPRYKDFGMFAARFDDLVNLIPARLSGIFIVIASFFYPGTNPFRALKIMWTDSSKHASPNAGWPEGAMAGAFDWALGGPRQYPGGVSEAAWIGSGKARLEPMHIEKAMDLYAITNITQCVIVLMVMVLANV